MWRKRFGPNPVFQMNQEETELKDPVMRDSLISLMIPMMLLPAGRIASGAISTIFFKWKKYVRN
jgi:hypothetical protein